MTEAERLMIHQQAQILAEFKMFRRIINGGEGHEGMVPTVNKMKEKVAKLNFRVNAATWVIGTCFTAIAFGLGSHLFDAPTAHAGEKVHETQSR